MTKKDKKGPPLGTHRIPGSTPLSARGRIASDDVQERITVESYKLATISAHDFARGRASDGSTLTQPSQSGSTKIDDERSMRMSRLAWAFLRDARLFHFDPRMYMEIYHQMDVFCTEEIAGLPYHPPKFDDEGFAIAPDVPDGESEKLGLTLMAASPGAPYPEHFPFESVFIGLGQGANLTGHQTATKFMRRLPVDIYRQLHQCLLLGSLMTFSGYVWEVFRFTLLNGDQAVTLLPERTPEDGWERTIDLAPWYLPMILDTINDHKTFVIEGYPGDTRKDLRHARKAMGFQPKKNRGKFWLPPPYYRVKLRDQIVRKRLEENKPKIAQQLRYRHDVRGHERCYIRRGPLPLDVETRVKLTERGYKVYEHTKPDAEMNARLLKRGHVVKKPDEWVAIMAVWIDEYQKGPEDGPYIPALRTTGGKESSFEVPVGAELEEAHD